MTARQLIERSVSTNWPEFARRHPALAAELSQEEYVAASLETLRQDSAYRRAIGRGEIAAELADWAKGVTDRVVKTVMRVGV